MSFLKAEWRNLILANYAIDPKLLKPYVPAGTELDYWNGICYVSLVGFMFVNTRVLGIKVPYHTNFEEVNLRFYVKHFDGNEWKRGVVFIKELVPRKAITMIANTLYHEHYQTTNMNHRWVKKEHDQEIEYTWFSNQESQSINVIAGNRMQEIQVGSEAEFITEHYWGYTKLNEKHTTAYQVTHPRWTIYPILTHEIRVDFETVYGKEFAILNHMLPTSVMLAEGSAITVEGKMKVE